VAVSGSVVLGIIESGNWIPLATSQAINGGPPLALGAVPDGGATLLVSDSTATQLTRFDLGLADAQVGVQQGLTAALLTEPMRALVLDGARDKVLVGGNTLGNLYILNAGLDAGPDPFDVALVSGGRLSPPVTGVAVYQGRNAAYLLVTSSAGLTIYDLLQTDPKPGAFRVIAEDVLGPLTGPTGVAVTNMDAGSTFPAGVIALGDATNRGVALVRWDAIPPDAGLVIDPVTDPRGLPTDGGPPDGGCDGGPCPPLPPSNPTIPPDPSPFVPPPDSSSCSTAPGGVGALAGLIGLLAVLALRRQRR
jgi:MYXO-CTERM domain-containing protein